MIYFRSLSRNRALQYDFKRTPALRRDWRRLFCGFLFR